MATPIKSGAKSPSALPGKTYNFLYVESFSHWEYPNGRIWGHAMFNCKCLLCGGSALLPGESIVSGNNKACGCLRKPIVSEEDRKRRKAEQQRNWRAKKKAGLI
jgi:hypothetical protein